MKKKNLDWMKFNRWTVISDWEILMTQKKNWKPQPIRMLKCQCECWTIREIRQWNLINWSSKSCWCHHKEVCRWLIKELHKTQKWSWNPNWRWWVALINSRKNSAIRQSHLHSNWSQQVKDKYLWKCARCDSRRRLNSHHIESFANNPDIRFDVSNWICLCNKCHKEFHFRYWKINNTITQINEFMGYPWA